MKRLLFALACTFVLAIFGPVPSASAHWWPWGHHSKAAASSSPNADASSAHKGKTPKAPKAKKEKKAKAAKSSGGAHDPLYTVPKSVGWWHKGPGPAGAGAK